MMPHLIPLVPVPAFYDSCYLLSIGSSTFPACFSGHIKIHVSKASSTLGHDNMPLSLQ